MTSWRDMRIVAAACLKDGVTFSIPAPARHSNIAHAMHEMGIKQDHTVEQGFLTDTGCFVRRKTACMIARNAGQVGAEKRTEPQDVLFSEDLW